MLRLLLAIWTGKIIFFFVRFLKIGGGSAAPGLYGLKTDPKLINRLNRKIPKTVLVTGTNGKTTSSRLISHFAKAQGLKVIHNSTGSNMERGIASKLIEYSNAWGNIDADLAVWEVDEANLKNVANKLKPQMIIILNAARDQLDRYGELDSLVREWREALTKINLPTLILVNGDDVNTLNLTSLHTQSGKLKFKTFGLDKHLVEWEENAPLGKKDYTAQNIKERGLAGISFEFITPNSKFLIHLPVPGIYNIYNFMAAFAASAHLGLSETKISESLKSFKPVFGRIEKFRFGYICLIKNPNSTSQTLDTLTPHIKPKDRILLALNDNLADGTDVSWIWDANFEILQNLSIGKSRDYNIICSGKRAEDLALRLKYASVEDRHILVEPNLKNAFNQAINNLESRLFVLPTYTALLEFQQILSKRGIKKHYWEEE